MPYDASQEEEENTGGMDVLTEQTEPSQDAQQQAVTPETGGESGIIQTPTAPTQGPSKTAGSGMFTNLQKYVEANKPKTKEMAGAVVKDVSGQADLIKKNAATKTSEFQTSEPYTTEKARLEGAQQTSADIFGKAQAGQQLSQEEVGQFQSLQKGTGAYNQFEAPDYTEQQLNAQKLADLGGKITASGGSEQAIEQTFGKDIKNYTQGEKGLDLFLLGQDPTARQDIQAGVTEATGNITDSVEAETKKAADYKAALANIAAKYSNEETGLASQVAAQKTATQALTDARLAERSGDYGQTQFDTAINANAKYGVDTSGYLGGLTASQENVRSADEAARLNALAQLSGQSGGYAEGTYNTQLQDIIGSAQTDISAQKEIYDGEVARYDELISSYRGDYGGVDEHTGQMNALKAKHEMQTKYGMPIDPVELKRIETLQSAINSGFTFSS